MYVQIICIKLLVLVSEFMLAKYHEHPPYTSNHQFLTPFDGGRGDYHHVWEFIRDWNIMKLVDYTRTEWTMAFCIHCVWEFIKEGMKGRVILYHLLINEKKKKRKSNIIPFTFYLSFLRIVVESIFLLYFIKGMSVPLFFRMNAYEWMGSN